jgi:hypothetical protein
MTATAESVEALIQNLNIDIALRKIGEKVLNNERITFEEGVLLYEKGELGFVGTLANYIEIKNTVTILISTEIFTSSRQIYVCIPASFVRIQG